MQAMQRRSGWGNQRRFGLPGAFQLFALSLKNPRGFLLWLRGSVFVELDAHKAGIGPHHLTLTVDLGAFVRHQREMTRQACNWCGNRKPRTSV